MILDNLPDILNMVIRRVENFLRAFEKKFSSKMTTRLRLSPGDCLETFSFPSSNPFESFVELESAGKKYHLARKNILLDRQIGLTASYNLFHDPKCIDSDIKVLRDLQLEMDHKVAEAYGWSDLDLSREWQDSESYVGEKRWALPQSVSDEVIDRLYELNQQRYKEEQENHQ